MSETPSRAGSTPPNKAQVDADAKAAEEAKVAEEAKAAEEAKQAKAAAAQAQAQAAQDEPEGQDPDNPKFAVNDLIANARTLTGYGKYVLAGALSKLDGDAFTIEEAKAAAEEFAAAPIDPDAPDNLTEVDPASGAFTVVEPTTESPAEES